MQTSHHQPGGYVIPARPSRSEADTSRRWMDELHRWEFALLQAAVFFAPYHTFRASDVYITLSDVFFAGAFMLRLYTGRMAAPFGRITWMWLAGLLMLTFGLFLGSAVKGDMVRGLILIAQYCFAYLIVPLILLRRPEHEVIRLMKCGIWGMVVMCILGLGVYMTSPANSQMWLFSGARRFHGFLENPNNMGVLCVMALPVTWYLLISRQMKKAGAILCMALLMVGVILSSSNTALYSMVAAILIFFGGRRDFKMLITLALLSSVVLTFGQDYLPTTFQNRVLSAAESGDLSGAGTFADRQKLNREALDMVDENLIIGLGADQYRLISRYGNPVHNLYLLLLNEGGGLSVLGFLVILGVPVLAGALSHRLPNGKLVLLTTITSVLVFANAVMGFPHVYGRMWYLFIFLAVSPALISYEEARVRLAQLSPIQRPARSSVPPLRT